MKPFSRFGRIVAVAASLAISAPFLNMSIVESAQAAKPPIPSETRVTEKHVRLPGNAAPPVVTGTPRVGATLTSSLGAWAGHPRTYAYAWYSCTVKTLTARTHPVACALIVGAANSTFALTQAQAGKFIASAVTATNASGSTSHWSASTVVVAGLPVNTVAPVVTGTNAVPQMLSVSNGTWTESPSSYSWQWSRCTARQTVADVVRPAVCSEISGATASTYTLTSLDVSRFMVAAVTATNVNGPSTRWSISTAAGVTGLSAPVNTVAPAVSGTASNTQTLSASNGIWTNSPTAYSYQWVRCTAHQKVAANTSPRACIVIPGATSSTYVLTSSDVSRFISVAVTATNSIGPKTKWSISTAARVSALLASRLSQ